MHRNTRSLSFFLFALLLLSLALPGCGGKNTAAESTPKASKGTAVAATQPEPVATQTEPASAAKATPAAKAAPAPKTVKTPKMTEEQAQAALEVWAPAFFDSKNKHSQKMVTQNSDGSWTASYETIDKASFRKMDARPPLSPNPVVQYIGDVEYDVIVMASTAKTKEAALAGPFTRDKRISKRELVMCVAGQWCLNESDLKKK